MNSLTADVFGAILQGPASNSASLQKSLNGLVKQWQKTAQLDYAFDVETPSEITSPLAALWDEPLSYIPHYAAAVGDVNQAYFLSWFIGVAAPYQWLPLNDHKIQAETGLTPKQWRKVREDLMAKDLLLNKRGKDARSLFRLDEVQLEQLLKQNAEITVNNVYHPPLVVDKLQAKTLFSLGLNVNDLLFLAAVQADTPAVPLHQRGDWTVWVDMPQNRVFELTYLSRREQDNAQVSLQGLSLIESKNQGFPQIRRCRVSLKRLAQLTARHCNLAL
ncbi:hypothetical protein [Stenoxybacter acetivorans]|uniref:hypothetical protein n=1 Tax=Stenoxybacter acetivorans TaxID=422441 RepID=UPI00056BE743|nr:hypothetical protein [Stenoxybacter acetivorans]